jgi:4-carboxymuconolactone decarboxylase
MDNSESKLGGRLPLLDPKALEGEQKKLYEELDATLVSWAGESGFQGKTEDGKFIGPFNPDLYGVGITPAFLQFLQAESKTTSLDKRLREVVILSTVAVWKAPYALYAHAAVARKVGVPEAAIQALVAGNDSEHLLPNEQLAYRFARQLSKDHRVDVDLYREAESSFGRKGLIDIIYLIGIYLLTAAMLNAFEIPSPE